jgi:hypothetical protein
MLRKEIYELPQFALVLRLPKLLDASSWGCHSRIIALSAIQNRSKI